MIKILFYYPDIDQGNGGIRQYALNLLKSLEEMANDKWQLWVYHDLRDPEVLQIVNNSKHCVLVHSDDIFITQAKKNNQLRQRVGALCQFLIGRVPHAFRPKNLLDDFIEKNEIDYVHVPYQFCPDLKKSTKLITTLHDVQELHYPINFTPKERAYRAEMYLRCTQNSHKIIVSYTHVAQDIINYFGVPSERIVVLLLNMKNLWFSAFDNQQPKLKLEEFHKSRYLFYPANFWPHKNHMRLLTAFKMVVDRLDTTLQLVLTGDATSGQGRLIQDRVQELNLQKNVHFAGVLTDAQLYLAYKNATAVVVPTLYEAGSFPLMEAILMNIAVICSNVTSLPETIGDLDFTFDPYDIDQMADRMSQIVTDDVYRIRAIQNNILMGDRLRNTGAKDILMQLYSS